MAGTVFFVALCGFLSVAYSAAPYKCAGVATYHLAFYGNWSMMTHPYAWPPSGGFSNLVGASHEDQYTIWDGGMMASPGVQAVAEGGNSATLEAEIMQRIMYNKTAWKLINSTAGIPGTGNVMDIDVEVTQDFPLVSIVTMLAPSPDWFTGIKKVSLCDTSSGMWMDSHTIYDLQPWDAGTDNGTTFMAGNNPTMPPGYIRMITKTAPPTDFMNLSASAIPTLGKMMFVRQNKPTMNQCSGMYYYTVKFEAKWSQATHPNGWPNGAHFSPLVIATHAYKYKMWSDMTRASQGVEEVAETGAEGTLYNEVMMMKKPGFVSNVYKTGMVSTPDGDTSTKIMVQNMYSMVSLITMIAPSPDWFVGVDSYDLCGMDGWKEKVTMDLLPWDAGTENGQTYRLENKDTDPVDVIMRITPNSNSDIGAHANVTFATVTFTRGEMITDSAPGLSAGLLAFLSVSMLAIMGVLY